jgi:hypothetical protein
LRASLLLLLLLHCLHCLQGLGRLAGEAGDAVRPRRTIDANGLDRRRPVALGGAWWHGRRGWLLLLRSRAGMGMMRQRRRRRRWSRC